MPGSVYDSRVPEGHYDIIKPKVSPLLRIASPLPRRYSRYSRRSLARDDSRFS